MSSSPAFFDALKKGTGRAMLLLQADPRNKDFHASLLSACLRNLSYDRQSEDSRAPWLLDMIQLTGRVDDFFDALVAALRSCDGKSEGYDILQMYELACFLAAKDPRLDRDALEELLSSPAIGEDGLWQSCANAFIELSGVNGLMTSLSLFQALLVDDFDNWGGRAFHQWVETLEKRDGVQETADALAHARPRASSLDEFMRRHAALIEAEERPKAETSSLDYESLKATGKAFPMKWIRQAPDTEITQAAADLLQARDAETICNYLMIFGRRDFPLTPEKLFGFVRGEEQRPAHLAARALGRLNHSSIRAYGLELLDLGRIALGLKLLRSSIAAADMAKIDMLLRDAPDDDDLWHEIGHSLLDIAAARQVAVEEYAALLVQLYQKGPCAICRKDAVRILRDSGALPDWMAKECAFDCDEETRSLTRAGVDR